jgi:hypothetical protein
MIAQLFDYKSEPFLFKKGVISVAQWVGCEIVPAIAVCEMPTYFNRCRVAEFLE